MKNSVVLPPPRGIRQKVIIIGGGVTGTMAAWELSRAGHDVTLLEARRLGNGASSRSAACIRQQFSTPATVRGMRYATRVYEQWQKLIGGTESPISQNGYLFLYDVRTNPDTLHATIRIQRGAGLDEVRFLTREEISQQFPYIDTTGLIGATWCPTDGFLRPDVIYTDAANAAKENGADIICNAQVTGAVLEEQQITKVITQDGRTFTGDVFINATSNWAPTIATLFNGINLPISTRRRYLYFLPGMGTKDECGLSAENTPTMPMIITPRAVYCRPEAGTQLMTGWAHYTPEEEPTFEGQDTIERGYSHTNPEGLGGAMRKELEGYIPAITEMGAMTAVTAGYYDVTPDHNPLIGFDSDVSNLIHAAGFSGHGVMHAPFTALIIAHLVAAGRNLDTIDLPLGIGEADLSAFSVTREFQHGESMVI